MFYFMNIKLYTSKISIFKINPFCINRSAEKNYANPIRVENDFIIISLGFAMNKNWR